MIFNCTCRHSGLARPHSTRASELYFSMRKTRTNHPRGADRERGGRIAQHNMHTTHTRATLSHPSHGSPQCGGSNPGAPSSTDSRRAAGSTASNPGSSHPSPARFSDLAVALYTAQTLRTRVLRASLHRSAFAWRDPHHHWPVCRALSALVYVGTPRWTASRLPRGRGQCSRTCWLLRLHPTSSCTRCRHDHGLGRR